MTGPGSIQLRLYLRARRDGVPRAIAAADCGLGDKEARFTDEDEARGLLAGVDLRVPPAWVKRRLGVLAETPLGMAAVGRVA